MSLTKIDMIIKELCRETGEPEYRNYDSFVGHIRRAFGQIQIAAVQTARHEIVELNSYNAINWPISCLKPIAVGLRRNGRTIWIDVDNDIIPMDRQSPCSNITECESDIDAVLAGEYTPDYGFDPFGNGEFYGMGPGYNRAGYVTHDKTARQSHVKGRYREDDEFLFIFLSDGISDGIEYVPVETENVLRAFALSEYWRVRNPNLSMIERNRYKEELQFLRNFYQAATAEQWAEAFNHNETSAPK